MDGIRWAKQAGARMALGLAVALLLGSCGGGGAGGSGGGGGGGGGGGAAAPGAPAIGAATVADGSLSVAFTPGAGTATSYTATCVSGIDTKTATGAGSPLQVAGLDNGVPWSCRVSAANAAGASANSAAVVATPSPVLTTAAALPTLHIDTSDAQEITSKEDYVTATYRFTATNGTVLHNGTTDIRGRGNSTWTYPKKPYRVRLASSTALMGMPANRHWVLLANYVDKTLVRTEAAFDLSEKLGLAWTPRSVPVVLYMNGDYRGIYQLVEHVRIGGNRVNIPELDEDDTSGEAVTGGYLIEVDFRRGEDYCWDSTRSNASYCFSNPETLLEPEWAAQKAYIDDYLTDTEDALFGSQFADPSTGYAAYVDVQSAIDWYIVNEFFKNVDSNFTASVYLYKKRNGKLFFGPVWDFDLSIGNADFFGAGDPTGWRTRSGAWFNRMFQDPAFAAAVRTRWKTLRSNGTINSVFATIDRRAAFYSQVQTQNFVRWPILNQTIPLIRASNGSYPTQVATIKTWLLQRRDWMDAQFN
jgi:hypothetical protein